MEATEPGPPVCLRGPGRPWPPGLTAELVDGEAGVNVAVHARDATAVDLCLFSEDGLTETARLRLPGHTDGVWHGFVAGVPLGQRYGLRAEGPWRPLSGQHFNPARLLIDPWTCSLPGDVSHLAREVGYRWGSPLQADTTDNASRVPKSRLIDRDAERRAGAAVARAPHVAPGRMVLYEAHVKSLTALHPDVPEELRGTYAGLASAAVTGHLRRLGVTTLCLLPVFRAIDERHLLDKGLHNHWGYNTLSYFVPEPRFATRSAREAGPGDDGVRAEFRQMVDRLHREGFEVVLDVVFNHTAEGDALGPTLCWRGLSNAAWYRLDSQGRHLNPSGCGNTFNMGDPAVVQLIMDSLRWWVQAYGVDGFRFDLAVALGRDPAAGGGFQSRAPLFAAIAQDPVLAGVRLIAEPWDLGTDGYRLGAFGPRWQEWNDQFRDTARAWWLGHGCTRGLIARRLAGSSDVFQPGGRGPTAGINLITAHDGFTLADLTSYRNKHNQANGEGNRDGHNHNLSANGGHEGPTAEAAILERRGRWRRALLATLLCAQGSPQLLAGDELGHSQQGNNNAYCQDNPITWLDWAGADRALTRFVAALVRLRQRYPGLRHPQWFRGTPGSSGWPDIEWRTASGGAPVVADWEQPDGRLLVCVITVGHCHKPPRERLMLVLHAGENDTEISLPEGQWRLALDSASGFVAADDEPEVAVTTGRWTVGPITTALLVRQLAGGETL
jgi:glycogen operon protein